MKNLPIHRHLAQTMDERLIVLNRTPKQLSIVPADGANSYALLSQRYPKAHITEYAAQAEYFTPQEKKWWQRHTPLTHTLLADHASLPPAQADMLWSNLGLTTSPDLIQSIENWSQHLQKDGLLFFSHFGRNSLPEIRHILDEQTLPYTTPHLLDMHDLGDMLFHHGFYDPVMDTAEIILEYQNFETLWQDCQDLNLSHLIQTEHNISLASLMQQAWTAGTLRQLTFETVFGHAIKKIQLNANESEVRFFKS